MKINVELKYIKTTPAGDVYALTIDGLETKPELVFPVVEGKELKDEASAVIDLEEIEPEAIAKKIRHRKIKM